MDIVRKPYVHKLKAAHVKQAIHIWVSEQVFRNHHTVEDRECPIERSKTWTDIKKVGKTTTPSRRRSTRWSRWHSMLLGNLIFVRWAFAKPLRTKHQFSQTLISVRWDFAKPYVHKAKKYWFCPNLYFFNTKPPKTMPFWTSEIGFEHIWFLNKGRN